MEAEIGDCTCAHCSYHRAVGAALDEHFAKVVPLSREEALARQEKLHEAAAFFDKPQNPDSAVQTCGYCGASRAKNNILICPNCGHPDRTSADPIVTENEKKHGFWE